MKKDRKPLWQSETEPHSCIYIKNTARNYKKKKKKQQQNNSSKGQFFSDLYYSETEFI